MKMLQNKSQKIHSQIGLTRKTKYKKATLALALGCGLSLASQGAQADEGHNMAMRADSHAPIGVMGDHVHKKGKWMVSYRVMNMHMSGMRSGTDDVSPDQVALMANRMGGEPMRMGPMMSIVPDTYRIAPLSMDMQMHMLGAMYGLTNDVTLMGMLTYNKNTMKMRTYQGRVGNTPISGDWEGETAGLGDTKLAALVKLFDNGSQKMHYKVGISLPTGSIDEAGTVLAPNGMFLDIDRLAYPMQLGSGTPDALFGLTYNSHHGDFSWGAQYNGTVRLGRNSHNYSLGDIHEGTTWMAYQWAPWISTSVRLGGKYEGSIDGRDMVITGGNPMSDPLNSGRKELNLGLGINLLGTSGLLKGHRLAFEVSQPIYQDLDGLQMKTDTVVTIGWQKAF